jgi:hypothetical protein
MFLHAASATASSSASIAIIPALCPHMEEEKFFRDPSNENVKKNKKWENTKAERDGV